MGDRNYIAEHLELGLEAFPEIRTFVGDALRSRGAHNRPPRMATIARDVWMARYVTFEKKRNPQKSLQAIYEDCASVFKKKERTVANAYRAHKDWVEFQNEKVIDFQALVVAVMRAHP
jgi:hypothetical protein